MELEKKYKYKFSIVMAIYNVEKYLEEAILSVVNQDIGFEESVQLILVNDGSPDNSNVICERYKALYPNNIIYIEKENGGVSSARNEGMKYIEGKYMNFLDGDDKFNEDVLRKVECFFEENYEYTDVVSIPVYFFEGKQGKHILNYKYKSTRQINLLKEYNKPQLFINSAFIKSEYKNIFKFTLNMKYAEDAEYINKVLLNKLTMGVVSNTKYWYRYRSDNSSAIQVGTTKKEWYTEYLKKFSISLLNYCKSSIGYVPKFIQYTIMYDLQWRFNIKEIQNNILDQKEQEEFITTLMYILKEIDDSIILEQRNISLAHKKYILSIKNGHNIENKLCKIYSYNNLQVMYKEMYLGMIHNEKLRIDLLEINEGVLFLEGCVTKSLFNENYGIEIEFNNQIYISKLVERKHYRVKSLGNIISKTYGFKIEIPIDMDLKEQILKIYLRTNRSRIRLKMIFGKFIRINQDMKSSYFITKTHRVMYKYNSIIILKNSLKVNLGRETRALIELINKKQLRSILMRLAYFIVHIFKKNEIWIFMDRIDKADDNAEYLFKYALNQKDKIKKFFVIDSSSEDYKRIKNIGKVISYNSIYHKFMLLLADKVISSQGEDGIRVPFRGNGKYVRELCDFKFVFLQHGITKDNLSAWLNKYNKNINMFITAVNLEYKSIIEEDYDYDENVVKLTGFPRFDGLQNNDKENFILIMPTWRSNTVSELNQTTGTRPYNDRFKESEYLKAYNSLLNNHDLLTFAKAKKYKIIFFPHPCIQQQINDFNVNKQIIIPKYNESYQELFNKSKLLITDYSSVAFDFAYMKKPVIYYQFDRDSFFKGHTYTEGYFDYEEIGMGEVVTKEEDLIKCVVDCLKNDCIMNEKYKKRVESFYKYTDRNNCKRVYDEIRNM